MRATGGKQPNDFCSSVVAVGREIRACSFKAGSLSKSSATIGMLAVAFLTAVTASGAAAKIPFIFSRTRSAANSGINSGLKFAKSYSIARFLPSTLSASARPRRNAASAHRVPSAAAGGGMRKPITGIARRSARAFGTLYPLRSPADFERYNVSGQTLRKFGNFSSRNLWPWM
jgi:hypothetical protein